MYLDNLYNPIELQGHTRRSRSHRFFVRLCAQGTAVTRGQYLALSKAWRSCFQMN